MGIRAAYPSLQELSLSNWTWFSSGLVAFRKATSPCVHIPDVVRDAGGLCDPPPLPRIDELGVGAAGRFVDDERADALLGRDKDPTRINCCSFEVRNGGR